MFQKLGLSLLIDGSKNHKPDMKGFSGIDIGNWRENTDSGGVGVVVNGAGLYMGLDNSSSDFQFADINTGHDGCDSIEFVTDGE